MGLFRRKRLFSAADDGFAVTLDPEVRQFVLSLARQLDELLELDVNETKRLFPTAYHDDPEREAGYQILARQQLIDSRREAISLIEATVDQDVLTEEELAAWMGIVNDLRLVLGTRLDVSEDDHDIDPEADDADLHLLYHQLGYLLSEIVDALTGTLPPPTVADDPV
ncbi:MAG: DUF2017 family protein [Actinomycetota bacterium]